MSIPTVLDLSLVHVRYCVFTCLGVVVLKKNQINIFFNTFDVQISNYYNIFLSKKYFDEKYRYKGIGTWLGFLSRIDCFLNFSLQEQL